MNFRYNSVYLNETSLVTGPYELEGKYRKYFDKSYNDLSIGEKSWELSEIKLLKDSVDILLNKSDMTKNDIDLHISGDLLNQLVSTNYASKDIGIPLIGIYGACSTSMLGLIIASNMIESKQANNIICSVSSHNNSAEKQFRYPVEYGGPKRKMTTFTVTGGCSALVSNKKSKVRITSGTIGKVIDLGIKDVNNMGAVMAPAAADTLYTHLKENNLKPDHYDLIVTGDLGIYGSAILKEYMKKEYDITLKNYEDAGSNIYDKNPKFMAGGSGPACLPLVAYGYIFDKLKKHKYKKVLLIATGALHSPIMCNEKLSIPAIAHAISLEVI